MTRQRLSDHCGQGRFGPEADKPASDHSLGINEDIGGQIVGAETETNASFRVQQHWVADFEAVGGLLDLVAHWARLGARGGGLGVVVVSTVVPSALANWMAYWLTDPAPPAISRVVPLSAAASATA